MILCSIDVKLEFRDFFVAHRIKIRQQNIAIHIILYVNNVNVSLTTRHCTNTKNLVWSILVTINHCAISTNTHVFHFLYLWCSIVLTTAYFFHWWHPTNNNSYINMDCVRQLIGKKIVWQFVCLIETLFKGWYFKVHTSTM